MEKRSFLGIHRSTDVTMEADIAGVRAFFCQELASVLPASVPL